jgi:predicted ATPase
LVLNYKSWYNGLLFGTVVVLSPLQTTNRRKHMSEQTQITDKSEVKSWQNLGYRLVPESLRLATIPEASSSHPKIVAMVIMEKD